ncbi:MAG: hypothetical protein AAF182_04675, partial [Pseudomonadota bacterium]
MTGDLAKNWLKILKSLDNAVEQVPFDDLWPSGKTLPQVQERVILEFRDDYNQAREELFPILSGDNDIDVQTDLTAEVLQNWQIKKAPSLCAIAAFMIDEYFDDLTADMRNALMMTGMLGEVEHVPIYHNNMHFRKVLLSATRLIVEHNEIYDGTDRTFDARDAALIMMSCAIHDLGHDG